MAQQLEKAIADQVSQMAIVATGIFPESGKNAELEFFVSTLPDPTNIEEFQNSLRVNSGKMICKKNPKTASSNRGTDLFGNHVEGVSGLDVELEAGEGAMCSAQGLAIYALRDGVAQIQTFTRPMVTANVKKNFTYKVSVSVVPLRVIISEEKINLTTNDAVEIRGNLKPGSSISSTSSIIITGNIEGQGYLSSGNSIIVQGDVHDSNLVSQKDASIRGSIIGTSIISKEQARIGGSITKSRVFTDQAIDVRGNIDERSIVISAETIAVAGNVDPSSHIESHDNIMVNGNVGNAELVSDKSIMVDGSISGGSLSAKDQVVISGSIVGTNVVADVIIAENACGCKLIANNSIRVKNIVESPNEQPTEINIGTAHFSAKRLEQNQLVISHAEQSINKLGQYFGS
ncbi:MAG: FapA family protein, partial [bacterium]|nr:FapA family protein [bacterium]